MEVNSTNLLNIITSGCDERIFLKPETNANKYNLHPLHFEGLFTRGSCTCGTLTPFGFEVATEFVQNYEDTKFEFIVKEQYRNMKEVLDANPAIAKNAAQAILACGLPLHSAPVRGGTDGSRLSFMGLPCPNIFTGEMAFHSKHEFVSVQDMEKAVDVLVELVQIWGASA